MEWKKRQEALVHGMAMPEDVLESLRGLAGELDLQASCGFHPDQNLDVIRAQHPLLRIMHLGKFSRAIRAHESVAKSYEFKISDRQRIKPEGSVRTNVSPGVPFWR